MKTKATFLFLIVFILSPIFSTFLFISFTPDISAVPPAMSSLNDGVSNYNLTQSVTYQVDLNFTLTHKSGPGDYTFKFARLNDRVPNSSLTRFVPPYQESRLLYNNISGHNPSEIKMGHHDKFNNTYDSFNATLSPEATATINQRYMITLNEISFHEVDLADIGDYNMSDEIFALYCNYSEPYYERNETSLISLSNSLVNHSDNPIIKAEKICIWVLNYLTYNGFLPAQEMGALWAYNNKQGDCSEYSSLMITLLRIQNIPARKVTGFLIDNNPGLRPKVGNTWNFHDSHLTTNVLRHAWVEYYVEGIGWIACDPTWDYVNEIDFLRFNLNVGAHFFLPPSFTISEFSNPIFTYTVGANYEFNYNIEITVIDADLAPLDSFPYLIIVVIFVGVIIAIVALPIILLTTRKRKKGIVYYDY